MKNKIIYIGIICVAVVSVAGFFVYINQNGGGATQFKCPENYTEDDAGTAEYAEALANWTFSYFEKHPEATVSDWSMAKTQLWTDNNCKAALERLKLSGKVEDLKPYELVDYKIQTVLMKKGYISELGFSFYYPNDMYVQNGSDGPDDNYRLLVIPNSYKDDENQDLTAIVISASLNKPLQTPLEWLKGPDSGADMSKGYSKIDVGGQEAISMNGRNWVTVDTPDNKYQISIATLPSINPNQSLVDAMKSIVESMVFDK